MKQNMVVFAIAAGMLIACDSSGEISLQYKNAAEIEIQRMLDKVAVVCQSDSSITRMIFEPYISKDPNKARYKMWEISNLDFHVDEAEISSTDRLNGTTFFGHIKFTEDMNWRVADDVYVAVLDDELRVLSRGDWSDWKGVKNGPPERRLGHNIRLENGTWEYKAHIDWVVPPIRDMIGLGDRIQPIYDDNC